MRGPLAVPGGYTVTLTAGGTTQHASFTLKADPRVEATAADLAARLGADPAFPLERRQVEAVLGDPQRFLGAAPQQADAFVRRVEPLRARFPAAATYRPAPIL